MPPFDDELRDALQHEAPPAGFAERVLARARHVEARRASPLDWRLAAAAAIVVAIAGGAVYQQQVRRLEGERAKEEVLVALRVTGEKLRQVQAHVSTKE